MLYDKYNRRINYLRVSVTDRCNYRCIYCMPAEGVALKPHSDILRLEDIARIVRAAAGLGIDKIRCTGGEPLIRRNIEYLIREMSGIEGIREVAMTTNGALLTPEKARGLKDAGLSRVNISLDTLDPKRFCELTRGGDIKDVHTGIDAAVGAGLVPVKINMVLFEDTLEREITEMREFCETKGLTLQTIAGFSLHKGLDRKTVAADRPLGCDLCNRLRLTADGHLKPCLFSDKEIKVDLEDPAQAIREAVEGKPLSSDSCRNRIMCQIGG